MTIKPYDVSFERPPVPVEGMAYWKRIYSAESGWVCVMPNGTYGDLVLDGTKYNIIPQFEYVRRRKDGALICVPVPRTITQAIASAPHMGELIRVEPDFNKVLEVCKKGDALFVLLPSKVWPDFTESKLAQAVYDANTQMSTLLNGFMGTLHDTPTWSDIYAAPDNQVLDGNVWIIRRNRPETSWSYFVDDKLPPPPGDAVAYWERGVEVHDGFEMNGWFAINAKGVAITHVMDGTEFTGPLPMHEYELLPEPDGGPVLGVLQPRTVTEAFDNGPLLGKMRASSSNVGAFIKECKDPAVKHVLVNHALWSELLHNTLQRKVMEKFELASQEAQLHRGYMGRFRNVEVWSDAFCLTEDKVVGNAVWSCYEVAQ